MEVEAQKTVLANTDEKKRIQYFWNINYEKKITLESNKQVPHHGKLHMSCLTKLEFLFHWC